MPAIVVAAVYAKANFVRTGLSVAPLFVCLARRGKG